jgi:hypothetical protein
MHKSMYQICAETHIADQMYSGMNMPVQFLCSLMTRSFLVVQMQ